MQITCEGQRVLVTAGAAGIGRAVAERFLEAGAKVHLCDVDEAALEATRAALPGAGITLCNVADEAAVDRLFEAAQAQLDGLDILVNNAGIAGPTKGIEDIALDEWQRTLTVNLTGQFLCARRAVPLLKAGGGGLIVNLSSAAGVFGFPLRTPYAASKWGVVGLTKSLAMELGEHKIRVNAICPGMVEGERIERVIAAKAEALDIGHEEMRGRLLANTSLRTAVTADDIAAMILYLASDLGERISGQALSVDGGVEALR